MHTVPLPKAFLLLLPLLAGCAGLRMEHPVILHREDWPTAGRSNMRLASAGETLHPPLSKAWEVDLSAGFGAGSPVVLDSLLLIGTLRGELNAVNLRTGKKTGSIRLGDALPGSVAMDGNIAIVTLTGSGESVAAYSLTEGKILWKESFGDVEMSPLLAARRVYVGTTSGWVYCLDAVTGSTIWKYEIPDNTTYRGFRATPAASDSLLFFGDDAGMLYAFAPLTGTLRWHTGTGSGIAGGIALVDSMVVTGTTGGFLVGCDASSGVLRWRYDAGSPVYAAPAASGDTVYVGSLNGLVHAVRSTNGKGIWQRQLGGPVNAAAVVSGDFLYLGTLKKRVFALLRWDGSELWSQEVDGRIKTPLALAHERLLVATDEHTVFCYVEEKR